MRQYMELKAARRAARDAERGQTGKSETEDESAETSVDDLDEFNLPKTTGTRYKRRTKKRTTGPGPGSTRSNDSLDTFTQYSKGDYGMSRMLTHVVKPISVLLDPEKRESQVELSRGIQHLGKLTPAYVTQSFGAEPSIRNMETSIQELQRSVLALMRAKSLTQDAFSRTLTDKSGRIRPNPLESYPRFNAEAEVWQRAVSGMNIKIKVIERSLTFLATPNEFFLEVCSTSNSVAAAYGLSQEQQKLLILSYIPKTSTLFKELDLLDTLTQFFDLASISSGTILTKAEIDQRIEKWRLDLTSPEGLTESLRNLKALLMDLDGRGGNQIDQRVLYSDIIRRLKRDPSLNVTILKQLDTCLFQVEQERDPIRLHQIVLMPLKELVTYNKKSQNNQNNVPHPHHSVKQIETPPRLYAAPPCYWSRPKPGIEFSK